MIDIVYIMGILAIASGIIAWCKFLEKKGLL